MSAIVVNDPLTAEEVELDAAYDEGYDQALLDVEARLAEVSKALLWECSDLKNPRTGEFWNERARFKNSMLQAKAEATRTAARFCEELRQDA